MGKNERNSQEESTIDLLLIFKALWKKAWAIVLSGLIAAGIGFSLSSYAIDPQYSSSIMLYVNSSSVSLGKLSISELNAAQSLVQTYTVILKSRTTLEKVIEKAELPYDYATLLGMISASSENNTEILKVTATCGDPYEAAKIVNVIAEVLPARISEIIQGSSMAVVDSGVPDLNKVSPSVTKYTAGGLLIGVMLAVLVIAVKVIMDDTIHDEEYILQNYSYPILAKVPNLLDSGAKQYGYYKQKTQKKRRR